MKVTPAVLALVLTTMPGLALAQLSPDSNAPIDITGDALEVIGEIATWTGRVRVVQGEAILISDRLIADIAEGGDITSITATGSVRYSNGKEAITGDRGYYDAAQRTIRITDNVVVTQGEQVMTGGDLTYWIDTGQIRFTSAEGGRIRGIFHTKSDTPQS